MDNSAALDLLDDLTTDVDNLETALQPLLERTLESTAASLPALSRARLYTLCAYTIESILFSYIRLNASSSSSQADARTHPVFTELKRVQQYMQKIELAENPDAGKRENLSLDKEAAARFIKAGLSGNDKYDAERKLREADQKVRTKRKLDELGAQAATNGTSENEEGGSATMKKKSKKGKKDKTQSGSLEVAEGGSAAAKVGANITPKKKKKKKSKQAEDGT